MSRCQEMTASHVQLPPGCMLNGETARSVRQFASKKEAVEAIRKIGGYRAKDATRVDILGFKLWVIADDHLLALTDEGYRRALQAVGAA